MFNSAPHQEDVWGSGSIAPCPGCFTSRERAPTIHWTGHWIDPRVGINTAENKSLSRPFGNNSQSLSQSPIVWYSSITSINSLSFCITTFSVSLTMWKEKYRLSVTIFIIVATVWVTSLQIYVYACKTWPYGPPTSVKWQKLLCKLKQKHKTMNSWLLWHHIMLVDLTQGPTEVILIY